VRILHVTTSFPSSPKDFSGAFVYKLIKAQTQEGLRCKVLCPYSKDDIKDWPKDFKVYRFKYASNPSLTSTYGGIPAALKLNPYLYIKIPSFLFYMAKNVISLAKDVDIIHAHWSICGFICGITRYFHKLPMITTLRGSDVYRAKTSKLYKLIHKVDIKSSNAVVCVSNSLLKELIELSPNYKSKVFFIPNGVGDEFYKLPVIKEVKYPIRFLFIGSLIELKQVELLISALSLIKGAGDKWLLTIAGDGPMRSSLERLCKKLGIEEFCSFLGKVPPLDIPKLIAKHHVLVLPSKREGRPNVVLEAMAAARLVVASDIDACRELISHNKNGLLFESGSPQGLYQTLKQVIDNPSIIPALGENARDWMIKEGLNWDSCAKRYMSIYKNILESH